VARTKEERDALRAELEQEEADEAERSKRGGGSSQNLHVDVTEAVRDKLITKAEGRRLLGLEDDGDGDGDGDGDDDTDDDDKGKGKGKGKKDDDDDDAPADRPPRRRGYFDSGD
jgi:hypothetical protein